MNKEFQDAVDHIMNGEMIDRDGPEALPEMSVDDFIAEISAEIDGQILRRANRFDKPSTWH